MPSTSSSAVSWTRPAYRGSTKRGGTDVDRFLAAIELDGLIDFVDEPPRVIDPVAANWNFPQ
jgi:hypothetical protein